MEININYQKKFQIIGDKNVNFLVLPRRNTSMGTIDNIEAINLTNINKIYVSGTGDEVIIHASIPNKTYQMCYSIPCKNFHEGEFILFLILSGAKNQKNDVFKTYYQIQPNVLRTTEYLCGKFNYERS